MQKNQQGNDIMFDMKNGNGMEWNRMEQIFQAHASIPALHTPEQIQKV